MVLLDHVVVKGLNIFVIMELTIATLFAQVLVMRHQMSCHVVSFFAFSAGSWPLEKTIEPPQQLCCLIPNTPVQYQLNSIIAMIVSQE